MTRLFYQNKKHLVTPHIQRKQSDIMLETTLNSFFPPFASIPVYLQACPETEFCTLGIMPSRFFLRHLCLRINESAIKIPCRNKEWSKTRQHIKETIKQKTKQKSNIQTFLQISFAYPWQKKGISLWDILVEGTGMLLQR